MVRSDQLVTKSILCQDASFHVDFFVGFKATFAVFTVVDISGRF